MAGSRRSCARAVRSWPVPRSSCGAIAWCDGVSGMGMGAACCATAPPSSAVAAGSSSPAGGPAPAPLGSATEWPEARVGALVMVWTVLFALSGDDTLRWSALGAGALITAIVWWQQRQTTPLAGIQDNSVGAEFIVYLTPLALVTLAVVATPSALVGWGGAVPVALAILYLGSGWLPRTLHLVVIGVVVLSLAVSGQWDGAAVAAGWSLVAVAASASGRWAGRPGASEVSAVLAPVAFLQLFTVALYLPSATDPPLTRSWA